jgi:tRNA(Ile)-lysidine synthase
LDFTRTETAAYCRARGLSWREDDSNASDAYARNRLRHELLPALQRVHPAAQANLLALARTLREEGEVLDMFVDDVLGGGASVSLDRLRALPGAMRRLVVQRMADEAAGGLAPGVSRRADELAALSDRGTAMLDVGCGLRAVAEYGVLRIERRGERGDPPAAPLGSIRLPIPGCVSFGPYEVRCEAAAPAPEPGMLDRAALGSELLVRCWRPGDRMAPLGLGGTKKLQDLFTARRIPRMERAGLPVVEAGGEIVWVAGVATSERFKITASTREAVRLSARI